jgi:hypothetical protein
MKGIIKIINSVSFPYTFSRMRLLLASSGAAVITLIQSFHEFLTGAGFFGESLLFGYPRPTALPGKTLNNIELTEIFLHFLCSHWAFTHISFEAARM